MTVKLYLGFTKQPVPDSNFFIYTFADLGIVHNIVANSEDSENFKLGLETFEMALKNVKFKTSEIERFSTKGTIKDYYYETEIGLSRMSNNATATLTARIPYQHMFEVRELIDAEVYKNLNSFFAEAVAEKLALLKASKDRN